MTNTKKTFNLFAISEARNVIFGIATLWIGLFHSDNLTMSVYTDNQFLRDAFGFFRGTGNVGVDMFLFLSGIGLFFSFTKDSNVISFWKKRLMRVLPSAFLIATVYVCFRYVNGRFESGFNYFFSRMTFTYFFIKGERVFWFISLILALYIVFPVFYRIIERFRWKGMLGLVALVVIFTMALRAVRPEIYANVEIALCRIPVFIIGIWAGKFVMEKKEISIYWLFAFLGVAIGMLIFLGNFTALMKSTVPGYNKDMEIYWIFLYRYASCPLGISLVVLDSYACITLRRAGRANLLRNFFEFVGMYSMEYYMIYLNINHYLERIYEIDAEHQIMLYFGSFVVSMVLCILVRKVCDFFMAYMQRKPKALLEQENSGISTKWYGFLIYEGLFVVAVWNIFVGIAQFYEAQPVLGVAYLLIAVLAIVTRIFLAQLKSVGPVMLYLLIALIGALRLASDTVLLQTIFDGGKKAMLSALLIIFITGAIIYANVRYFKKRQELFVK